MKFENFRLSPGMNYAKSHPAALYINTYAVGGNNLINKGGVE